MDAEKIYLCEKCLCKIKTSFVRTLWLAICDHYANTGKWLIFYDRTVICISLRFLEESGFIKTLEGDTFIAVKPVFFHVDSKKNVLFCSDCTERPDLKKVKT